MRKLLFALLATLLFMGSSASLVATAQDGTPASDPKGTQAENSNPVDPKIGESVTYYGEDGNAVGMVTVNSMERGWEDYDEYSEPDNGNEYIAFTITVESTIDRGAIEVSSYDFSLQTATGFLWSNAYASADNAEPPLLEDDVSLASGDSEEFTVIFEVFEGEELAHLFWQPDSGIFITAAQLEGE